MFGFLNVYKPVGKTSHDVVAILRRITKIKQIGHTGTLDPFAEGVLPICIGKATRLIEYLDDEKAYIGTIQLGSATATFDSEGEVTFSSDIDISLKDIEANIECFKGDIEQTPPIYSAIKLNGKKLYEYAREGKTVEIKSRKVNISSLEILDFNPQTKRLELYIKCSKGTYIRSIANDLGEKLGVYGHLIKLVRVQAGKFLLDNSLNLDSLSTKDIVEKNILSPLDYLSFPRYELSDIELEKVSHGMAINTKLEDGKVVLKKSNNIVAIGNCERSKIKMLKVFL